ncbi:hypothetical protein LY78DRAFT_684773 [Colletotrichum sublineola]|uniref:Uncharacterized protein n=1 Tax=Colletotrichum sublineola TaxID=1173701 RepID=A0A066WX82_COLSU|nr:hypothetical protein LY78DRAFT_684773 [Colletotrichum sublineola]KDN60029.1 hypothetical protein CSUB01_09637 [Colletotrichum sublineola]
MCSVTQSSRSIKQPKLAKRGDFIGPLICPVGSSDSADIPSCLLCGETADDATAAAGTRKRYGTILERADSCQLSDPSADNPSCNFACYIGAKRGLSFGTGLLSAEVQPTRDATALRCDAGVLQARSVSTKRLTDFVIGNDKYSLIFGKYSPCADARTDRNILKNLIFQSKRATYPGTPLETDHVDEEQTLGGFYAWLARGTGTSVGTYSLALEKWVVEWNLGPVFEIMVFSFGRSDGVAGGPFTKACGESHLVLLQTEFNFAKGTKWFKGNSPDLQRDSNPTADRQLLRNNFGPFQYLQWAPAAGQGQVGPFPVVEPEWNKWMRVSNWIDLVCWSFDNQFANDWNTWPGAPTNRVGNSSLHALYARYIEDELFEIEGNVAAFATRAKSWYWDYYSSLKADSSRDWFKSNGGDPA